MRIFRFLFRKDIEIKKLKAEIGRLNNKLELDSGFYEKLYRSQKSKLKAKNSAVTSITDDFTKWRVDLLNKEVELEQMFNRFIEKEAELNQRIFDLDNIDYKIDEE